MTEQSNDIMQNSVEMLINELSFIQCDQPPIGIILCAGKNETLVKYATAGLSQKVFVSKYLINLPTEKELCKIIEEEQR